MEQIQKSMVLAQVLQELVFVDVVGNSTSPDTDNNNLCMAVDFHGPCNGKVVVKVPQRAAHVMAQNMICEEGAGLIDEKFISSVVGEITNVLAGNLMPYLYGEDKEVHLGAPYESNLSDDELQNAVHLKTADGTISMIILQSEAL